MMKSILRIAAVGVCVAGAVSAAEVQGVLMDKMCSAAAEKEGQAFAAKHDTKCALEASCAKSGYGVFTTDGKFLSFDAAGNAKAAAALKSTKKVDNLKVSVMGDVTGSSIKVASLSLQ